MAKPDLHGDIDFGNLNQSISLAAREKTENAWAVRYFDDVTALRLYVLKLEGQLADQVASIPTPEDVTAVTITVWAQGNHDGPHQYWDARLTDVQLAGMVALMSRLPDHTGTDDVTVSYSTEDGDVVEYGLSYDSGEKLLNHLGALAHKVG
jgi:hypothetical protein